ncbi:conserved hypothetical protein [Citreicella sp. SE45]|nr:conserved hypothetical protein [Citreicella sp. SE45]
MRRLLFGLMVGLMLAAPAGAQEADAIRGVIRGQMDAFRTGDVDAAFEFASPGIQGLFGTADSFGQMVREGYPMVWHPQSVEFGSLSQTEGALWQRVIVRDGQGMPYALDYMMEQINGAWRIGGVRFVTDPAVSA